MNASELAYALARGRSGVPKRAGTGWLTLCPAHEDLDPSLSIRDGNGGRPIVKCHGGCDYDRVKAAIEALGLDPWPRGNSNREYRIIKIYDYFDQGGKPVFQVCRLEPKSFRQRRPDGKGGWIWKMDGVPRVPYRLPEVLQAEEVAVVEGEKDADALSTLGVIATCNPGGAGKWRTEFREFFRGKKVVILPDNDEPGRAHAQNVALNLHGVAAVVKLVELPGLPDKGDVSDWIKAGGTKEQLLLLAEKAPEWKAPETPKFLTPQAAASQAKAAPAIRFVSGKELEALNFPEPVWIIPGLITEGYVLLAGRPKLGKSWLGLCLAVAVATGGCALGKGELRVVQGEVLYLALEDRLRRIKNRLGKILCGSPFPENLLIAESWQRLDKGGLDDLKEFFKAHDGCRLVVIDTLAKVRPPRAKNRDPYEWDMAVGGALQSLANQFRVSILVVHHTRKAEADDPLDSVSGTTGITGAADAVMILKRGRGQADGTLTLAGRDIEEQELALKFHPQEGAWELLGDAAEYAKSKERQEIIKILRENGPKTPKEIADLLEKKQSNIKVLLWKMVKDGEVKSVDGVYEVI